MMFFARGPKCGRRGAIGLGDPPGAAPRNRFSLSNDASAMPPNPIAHRLKKWRRVKVWRESLDSKELMVTNSTFPEWRGRWGLGVHKHVNDKCSIPNDQRMSSVPNS